MLDLNKPYFRNRPDQLLRRICRGVFPASKTEQLVQLFWDLEMGINIQEVIGNSIWRTGIFELGVSEALWRLVTPGDFVLDVGANIGYMTSLLARRAGSKGELWSFEPHPTVRARLEANVARYRTDPTSARIRVFPEALSSDEGEATLISFADHNEGTSFVGTPTEKDTAIPIRTRRLDNLLADETRTINVMKVDVEGHERSVFAGATRVLTDHQIQNIVYEDHIGPKSPVHTRLVDFGYTTFSVSWNNDGLLLKPFEQEFDHAFDAANYVATLDPDKVMALLTEPGWHCLRTNR